MRFKLMCLAVVAVATAGLAVGASSATAATPNGVGIGVHVTIANATLYQCPSVNCNQGVANPGDDVADICVINAQGPGGGDWNLVLNHANNQVGWIAAHWLSGALTGQLCGSAGQGATTGVSQATYQCPYVVNGNAVCNIAHIYAGDNIAYICTLPVVGRFGYYWTLFLDHSTDQVGWLDNDGPDIIDFGNDHEVVC